MKNSILILGASGMLGSMILDVFDKSDAFNLIATTRNQSALKKLKEIYPHTQCVLFDVERNSIDVQLASLKPAWIINAIGIIKPFIHDDNVLEVERAIKINSLFPYDLANHAQKINAHVIQIATDCVYSGQQGNYNESDKHDALDAYGKTKSLGEVYDKNFYNLRCSIIGPEINTQNSLLEWILHQPKNTQLNGFTNHHWNGITTLHFAKICEAIITSNTKLQNIHHLVPADSVSKEKLLQIIAHAYHRDDLTITPKPAPTPVNRTLTTNYAKINKSLWQKAGYPEIPTIKEMINELANYSFS